MFESEHFPVRLTESELLGNAPDRFPEKCMRFSGQEAVQMFESEHQRAGGVALITVT